MHLWLSRLREAYSRAHHRQSEADARCDLIHARFAPTRLSISPSMASLASLIHSHAYTLDEQIADGVFHQGAAASSRGRSASSRRKLEKRRAEADASADEEEARQEGGASKYIPPTSASFYIPSLPGLAKESTLTLYGGHLPSTVTSATPNDEVAQETDSSAEGGGDAHLFFFLAKAKHIADREKLVIWLNGGGYGCERSATGGRQQASWAGARAHCGRMAAAMRGIEASPYAMALPSRGSATRSKAGLSGL